jgi:hypothetical protein
MWLFFLHRSMQKLPKARPGIAALLQHPFLLHYDDGGEEVIAVWVRRLLEQMRIMQRFPSDTSLASTSSSVASSWSGVSLGRSVGSGGTGGQNSKFGGTIPAGSSLAPHHHLPPAPHIPPGTGSTVGHAPSSSHYHHHPLMDTS